MTLEPKPAATIALARDSAFGPQVLLVERLLTSAFGAGAWVFPGGGVEPTDATLARLDPDTAAQLSARMGIEPDVAAAYLGAAIRECWEETGIVPGSAREATSDAATAESAPSLEQPLQGISSSLDLSGIVYLARWVTPPGQSRRYDTRFFVAQVEDRCEVRLAEAELASSVWITPALALARNAAGEMRMMPPTVHTLRSLAGHESVTGMLRDLREHSPESYLPGSVEDRIG